MLDQNVSLVLNGFLFKSYFFDYLIYFLSQILPFILFFTAAFYFIFVRKNVIKFFVITLVSLGAYSMSEIFKFIISRPRPFVNISEIAPLFNYGSFDSFPSGHATIVVALSTAVYFENKKMGILFFVASFLVAFSRVFAGVHYLTDILVGSVLGFAIVFLSYKYIGKLRNKS